MVITRFAPSPTGNLHIGGCRTLLYNWLFAKKYNGKLILRIEDTDLKRSTDAALQNILEGIKWLGLNWDDEIVYQSDNINRHREIAFQLLEEGKAYKCYCTEEELGEMREEAIKKKKSSFYNNKWRDREPSEQDKNIKPVIRIKTPQDGKTEINDSVQGAVHFENEDLDDFIILRSDESPTYLLASAVDDHDMGVTHIIRGDDHLNNAARQHHIFKAMSWKIPEYTHIPLIHSSDGAKLSKRDGDKEGFPVFPLNWNETTKGFKEEGFLAEAFINYLALLGWNSGTEQELFSLSELEQLFSIEGIQKGGARFDFEKAKWINHQYINNKKAEELLEIEVVRQQLKSVDPQKQLQVVQLIKERLFTLNDLTEEIVQGWLNPIKSFVEQSVEAEITGNDQTVITNFPWD